MAHGRRSAGRRAHRGSARARLHTAPGRALDGAAGARELTSDDGRRSPVTRPVLGRPAPRRSVRRKRLRPRSRARSVFEVQSQQPGNFSLHVQDRCARCATRAPGEPLAPRARAPSHPAGCVRPVSRRASSRPTPAASPCASALRQAVRCGCTSPRGEAGGPPRRAVCSDPPAPESAADTLR